jgi:hypothetical protein
MGGTPAEIAEGAEGYRGRGNTDGSELFSAMALVCRKPIFPKSPPPNKAWIRGMNPTHPRCQIGNATAVSAGGTPGSSLLGFRMAC